MIAAAEELDAVDAAVQDLAIARAAGLVGAEDVRDFTELTGLAPDLGFPEAGHRARIDHRFEILAVGLEIEFEDAFVCDAYHACAGRQNHRLERPVRALSFLETDTVVHFGGEIVEI